MAVLEVNKLLLIRKEITGLQIGVFHAGWVDFGPVKFQEIRAVLLDVCDQRLFVKACRGSDNRHFRDGIEERLDPGLELLLHPVPVASEENEVLLLCASSDRRLKNEAVIDAPLLRELLVVVAFGLDPVLLLD